MGGVNKMVFIEWNKDLELGFEKIDEQHKQLIDIINRAYETSLEKDKKKRNEILNELTEFVRVHFSTEEKYFEECHYAGAEEHIEEHMGLIEKVLKFKNEFEEKDCDCEAFLTFLKEWLEEHLMVMDKKYVKSLKECGIK